jgi:hypothetical protein
MTRSCWSLSAARPEVDRTVNRRDTLLLIAVMMLTLFMRALPGPRTIDDAFITFRYSRNIAEGAGFVYNPGVHTLGTTTPLYTLLMAAAGGVFGTGLDGFPWYALAVNALADALTAALLLLIVRRLTGNVWAGALLGALWALAPVSVTFAVGGMETSVAILWLVAATYMHLTGRPVWLGVFIGLGYLTRIDSLLWSGPLLLWQLGETWRRGRGRPVRARLPWRTWLAAALVALPWTLFAWGYFGSPLPNSVGAKTVAYTLPAGAAFQRLLQFYPTPFGEYDLFGVMGALAGIALYLPLTLIGLLYTARRQPRLLPFLLYPWLYMAVFSLANPLIFRWYVAPPLPALMLGVLAGVWALVDAAQTARPAWRIAPVTLAALALLWGAASLSGWTLHPDHGADRPAPVMAWHQIELYYRQMAETLVNDFGVTPQTRVAAGDIGTLGYFTRAQIVDTVGLVTPAMSAYYPLDPALIPEGQNYAIPPQLILDTLPDFLVTMEAFVRLGLAQDARFQDAYTLVNEIPTDFYGTGMRLYQRVP